MTDNRRNLINSSHSDKNNFSVEVLPYPIRNLSALLVEDAPENQFLMTKILSNLAIAVEVANNGQEGIEMAMAGNHDFILMDMQMPILDGYCATQWLRENGYKKPIIALTADALAEERARILASGCDAHLTKPVNFVLLMQTISNFTCLR